METGVSTPAGPRIGSRGSFARFVAAGIGNTAFSYGAYCAALYLGLDYAGASLVALVLGVAVSYGTQSRLVFAGSSSRSLLRFIAAWAVLYGVNVGMIALLTRLSMSAYAAGALTTVPMALLSYLVLKFMVFPPPRDPAR